MKRNKPARTLSYSVALISIIGGCIAAVLKKETISELFGVGVFVFLGLGILIDVITEIIVKPDS
jgi:hypothetical protein